MMLQHDDVCLAGNPARHGICGDDLCVCWPSYEKTPELDAARAWLKDLDGTAIFRDFEDADPDEYEAMIEDLSDQQVVRAIDRHFDGGWLAFLGTVAA